MHVVGHGIDLADIAKLGRWIEDPRDPLIPRCFVQAELDEVGNGVDGIDCLAGRFAAKEAPLEAIGTCFGAGVALTDVVTLRTPGAPPGIQLSGGAERAATALGVTAWQLSISHAGGIAMASALALGAEAGAIAPERRTAPER